MNISAFDAHVQVRSNISHTFPFRAIRESPAWSEERKKKALEACKAVGAVMEHLEERNEMSETPLIREAADGNAKNVLLLLEAGADVDAQQMNNIGFSALNQAGACIFLSDLAKVVSFN